MFRVGGAASERASVLKLGYNLLTTSVWAPSSEEAVSPWSPESCLAAPRAPSCSSSVDVSRPYLGLREVCCVGCPD